MISDPGWLAVHQYTTNALRQATGANHLAAIGLYSLTLARVELGKLLRTGVSPSKSQQEFSSVHVMFDQAIDRLLAAGQAEYTCLGRLGRAAFYRSVGDWVGVARDLDDVEEIAGPGPMRLYLCDMMLERARLAFAKIEGFAPLNGLIDDKPCELEKPSDAECQRLRDKATQQLVDADKLIQQCGYHRRDEELAELQFVLRGERTFASLPPRV
jgi:hypothetical protein